MKKGFTLQELLITLGIIGIVAAVLAPAISNISPNKYKTRYMKAYNTLTRIVTDMIEDEDLFPNIYDDEGKLASSGFKSKSAVAVAPYNESSSIYYISNDPATNCKFDKIFASRLNINTSPEFCKDSNSGRSTFRTNDGTEWIILTANSNTFIAVDVDPDEENGKGIYSETNTNPHIFTFWVKSDGGIQPTDAMGMAYLQNSTDMKSSNEDQEQAKRTAAKMIESDENYNEIKSNSPEDGTLDVVQYVYFKNSFKKTK